MLLRVDDRGVLAIGQPSHAWISGQLARAWGNDAFGTVEPWEEVCLAAEQHDIGMAAWDLEPSLNPDTGFPHSFLEMPIEVHLRLWTQGPRRLLRQSRYAALLASMHATRLYEQRNLATLTAEQAELLQGFFADQGNLERELLDSLRRDPLTAPTASDEVLRRASQLVWTWDWLSLAICLDWAPDSAKAVPTAAQPVELALRASGEPQRLILDPWPFRARELTVSCEGQRLTERSADRDGLRDALAQAPWETLRFELWPADASQAAAETTAPDAAPRSA